MNTRSGKDLFKDLPADDQRRFYFQNGGRWSMVRCFSLFALLVVVILKLQLSRTEGAVACVVYALILLIDARLMNRRLNRKLAGASIGQNESTEPR